MTTTQEKLLTADDLLRLHSEGVRGELIRGVLCTTMAAGGEHGEIVVNMTLLLGNFVKQQRSGRLAASDAGVRLQRNPDTVREPDLAFISADRLPLETRVTGYYEVPPDLVVEIVSPNDSYSSVHDKACMWLRYGVRIVWVVNPQFRSVEIHSAGPSLLRLTEDDTLDGAHVLPGFSCTVSDLFDL